MKMIIAHFIHIISKGLANQKELLAILAVFILADYLTEIMVSIVKRKVMRGIGVEGILKRLAIFILVFLTNLLDVYVIQNGDVVTVAIILFYLSYEGIAVLKNIAKLGLPFPEVLMNMLEKMKNDGARP